MMTRHRPRRHISRPPYPARPKGPPIRNSPLHYFGSFLLCRLLLSLLPLKPCPPPRTRRSLTSLRNYDARPLRGPTTQYCCASSIWRHSHLSSSQHYGRRTKTRNSIPGPNYPSGLLLHLPSSTRILRSPFHYRRWGLRLYLLRSHRLPRPPRHHRIHLPSNLPTPTNPIPLYI